MDRKLVLLSSLLSFLLLCVVGSWWLSNEQAVVLARATDDTATSPDVTAAHAAPAGDPAEATHSSSASGITRATAATATGSQLPFPDDATWIPVLVVDGETREPVAGADVGWVSESVEQVLKDQDPYDPELRYVWRSVELQIDKAGWRTTTDANGMARVTYKRWTTVIATTEGRFGRVFLPENTIAPPGGYVLELMPDLTLSVQVVDDQEAPVPAMPIAVGVFHPNGVLQHLWDWGPVTRTTAPDGRAVLRHLQQLREEHDTAAAGASPRWRVRTYLPGFDDPGVEFSLDALPVEPIVLRLPACGSVRARAEVGGLPVPGFTGAGLVEVDQEDDWRPERAHAFETLASDGWVHFPHVPLGRQFEAQSYSSGRLATTFTGPVHRGQQVSVVITPTNECILLSGRLLAGEQRPLRDGTFHLEASGPEFDCYAGFRTDADGRFLVSLGEPREDNAVEKLRLVSERAGQPPLRLDLPPRTLRPGVENLGDLVMAGDALVVAGTFLDANGPRRQEVSFWVERFEPTNAPDEAWQSQDDVLQHQDGTGRFEVRGNLPAGRLRLVFASHDTLPMEPVEFRHGTDDLQVQLATGHPLTATVLPPRGAPPDGVYAVLQPSAPPTGGERQADDERLRIDAWRANGDRLYLQWPALVAGQYTLSVYLWTRGEPVVVVRDVQVPAAAGGDPRLADIDLRAATRAVTLHLFDAAGTPLEYADGVAFAVGQEAAATWHGTQVHDVTTRLLVPAADNTELLLAIQGFQPRRVPVSGERLDVRLESWPTVEIVVADLPALPPDVGLQARLVTTTPNEAPYRAQWSTGARGEYFDAPGNSVPFTDGRAEVPVGQGPHRVELHLVDDHRWIPIEGVQPATVLPNSGRVHVTVSAATWQEALQRREREAAQQQEHR